MADLVLGLAKSTVEGTLTMVKSAIEEEEKLQKSVKRDLMLISDEFEMMRSFLNVTKERATDDMSKTLVRQVRDMALDVEDCIESVVHIDNGSNWWRRTLPSCMSAAKPAAAFDDAIADIELLKARVEALGQRNMRYSHNGDSGSKPAEQMDEQVVTNTTESDMVIGAWVWDPVKKPMSRMDLVELINKKDSSHQLRVISVLGTRSDLGTMSIKKAYDDLETHKSFRCRAWVKVMHPFNPHELIRSLLAQFYRNYCPQQENTAHLLKSMKAMVATDDLLIEEFMRHMNQKYLVVLEDVSSVVDWEAARVYLPDTNNGSCIVVHTQQLGIASLFVGYPHRVSELEKYSADHSVCVFYKEDGEECDQSDKQKAAPDCLNNFECVGRRIDSVAIYVMLLYNDIFQVSSVWGIAGVGKSSLVKSVYSQVKDEGESALRFGWVSVPHPFNLRDLSRSLLLDLLPESVQHGNMLRIKDLIQECREVLQEGTFVVVIDDVQCTKEWDLIKDALALGDTQSRIVVITNEKHVAEYCATAEVWNVKGLQADEALDLFKQEVYEKTGWPDLSPEVTDLAKLVLHKCGGLPKVIVAVARYICSRLYTETWWTWILSDRFMHVLETSFGDLRSLFAWLHCYFRTCPDSLKPCIFYLSIFPVNYGIRRRRLVRRWIAEGYSRDTERGTAEETAEDFFCKLVELSMIQQEESWISVVGNILRMPLCQVNGFFREYIISRSMEENLVVALEGSCSMNSQRTGRHLAIEGNWDRDRIVFDSTDFSRLRSLTVFGRWESFFVSDKMRLLRVMDLEDASDLTDGDLEQMVKKLPRLKFLSLRGHKEIDRLPDTLGVLRHLQTLDIRYTSVVTLPKSIIKLQKLQYIRAGTGQLSHDDRMVASLPAAQEASTLSKSMPSASWLSKLCTRRLAGTDPVIGVEVPRRFGNLSSMHTLGVVDIGVAEGKTILKELSKLTQLHKLGVAGINRDNCQELCSVISGHAHLESLSVWFDEDNQAGCLDDISPPENLRSLKMYRLVGKLPVWIKDHRSLGKLCLQMTKLWQEEIDVLGSSVPKLRSLRLCLSEFQDGELHFGRENFAWICFLEIACNNRLQAVTFHYTPGSSLEVLRIHCCGVPSTRFYGLEHLKGLKEVRLSGTYDDALEQHLEMELAEHPSEVKPVLRLEGTGSSTR